MDSRNRLNIEIDHAPIAIFLNIGHFYPWRGYLILPIRFEVNVCLHIQKDAKYNSGFYFPSDHRPILVDFEL